MRRNGIEWTHGGRLALDRSPVTHMIDENIAPINAVAGGGGGRGYVWWELEDMLFILYPF